MHAVDAFRAFANAQHLSASDIFALSLGLEECASNIVRHAYGGNASQGFRVTCEATADTVTLTLCDQGQPLDDAVLNEPVPVKSSDSVGGWGLHLARSFLDRIEYARRGNENIWRLTKHLVPTTPAEDSESETPSP
jgi:serine/threonine-protein kinase RsbW